MTLSKIENKALIYLRKKSNYCSKELYEFYPIFRRDEYTDKRNGEMFKQFIRFGEFKGYKYLLNKDQGLKYLNEFAAYTRELAKDAKTINEFRLENFKVTAGFANAAIKALLIGNGGALVALSAFRQKLSVQEFTSMLPSVPWFMLGTIAAILLPLVEYIGQSKKRIDTELEIFPGEECGKTYNYLSRFIAFISLVAFGVGLLNLYCAMK